MTNRDALPRRIAFNSVSLEDAFWSPRIRTIQQVTLNTCLDKCEETGRISNFEKAAGTLDGQFEGIYFNDSDVYKVLEGVAYTLMLNRDEALEKRADEIIDKIASAQQEDGYLLCYYILAKPDEKWTDMDKHEMYCAGHLMEAAIAYHQATGKDVLLKVACKLADHFDQTFGPDKRHWVPGHQEIELALVKLYQCTGVERYLSLANFLLEERGHGHGKGGIWDSGHFKEGAAYCQDHIPVTEQEKVSGHAVRAMYMYAGMADVAIETGNDSYLKALDRLWDNVVLKNMYITGGIGPSKENEGFTTDFDLPNDTAYCETCASVAMVYWNDRMNNLHQDAKYADVMERAMYNGSISGVSLAGDTFFYVNPLSSNGTHHRQPWFDCSCCPTQISRFLPSVGGYMYRVAPKTLWVNMYAGSSSAFDFYGEELRIRQETNYPWSGSITYKLEAAPKALDSILLRIPEYCDNFTLEKNGKEADFTWEKGYARIAGGFASGDTLCLKLDMPVKRVYADERVAADKGLVAIQKGPLVYCAEQADNANLYDAVISDAARFTTRHDPSLGVDRITVLNPDGSRLSLIPYYAWDNREPGAMTVWFTEKKEREGIYTV